MCTYLSHYLAEGHLFKVGGLATHVGACYDHKIASLRDVDVIGDWLLPRNALQDWVATLLYCQCISEFRTHCRKQIIVFVYTFMYFYTFKGNLGY